MKLSDRLEDLKEQMKSLLYEIEYELPRGIIKERAMNYWYSHIVTALDNDHSYLGGSMVTMEDTINELREEEMEYEDEDEK